MFFLHKSHFLNFQTLAFHWHPGILHCCCHSMLLKQKTCKKSFSTYFSGKSVKLEVTFVFLIRYLTLLLGKIKSSCSVCKLHHVPCNCFKQFYCKIDSTWQHCTQLHLEDCTQQLLWNIALNCTCNIAHYTCNMAHTAQRNNQIYPGCLELQGKDINKQTTTRRGWLNDFRYRLICFLIHKITSAIRSSFIASKYYGGLSIHI